METPDMSQQREHRRQLLAQAEKLLSEAVAVLDALSESYPAGKMSSFHPKLQYSSMSRQIDRQRKTLVNGRI
jgi:hypothetical protein